MSTNFSSEGFCMESNRGNLLTDYWLVKLSVFFAYSVSYMSVEVCVPLVFISNIHLPQTHTVYIAIYV